MNPDPCQQDEDLTEREGRWRNLPDYLGFHDLVNLGLSEAQATEALGPFTALTSNELIDWHRLQQGDER